MVFDIFREVKAFSVSELGFFFIKEEYLFFKENSVASQKKNIYFRIAVLKASDTLFCQSPNREAETDKNREYQSDFLPKEETCLP